MKPNNDAILAQIVLQEIDRIIALGLEPTLEVLVSRLETRRPEIELASKAVQAFRAGGER